MAYGGVSVFKPDTDRQWRIFTCPADAREAARPYGFELLWYENYNAANDILAPPVLPYTWALALKIGGDVPVVCKLLLLPWSLVLVFALVACSPLSPGWELPLTAFTAFSPALLPSLNVMLDVPALALS